jgi:hypothetical protein
MKNIDICIYKENNIFFVDLLKWKQISDIPIQIDDMFNFSLENKKYFVKVIEVNSTDAKLKLL